MKKLLTALLTLLMVFTLVGCNSKEDTPIVNEPEQQEEVVEPINEDEPIVGGFVDAEDKIITDELKDIFNEALDGLTGAKYEPVELVATQVVNGINYKFLANGTKTTNPVTKGSYYIYVNKDLQGNVSLLDIETIEEKQEEVKTQDITQMSFWVVFYDQYGNELQREALKYGTVPEYKTWLPEGFDKWVYKKSGKDVGTLKAITGNTYYQAVCHEVDHSSSDPTPVPTPTPVSATLTMENGDTAFDWNKFTITITGTDIVAGRYYFASSTIVNEADNLEELVQSEGVTLTDEQIQSINSAGGLSIIKKDLAEGTYKTVLVVSNSDGNSKTIVVEGDTGEAPPPM